MAKDGFYLLYYYVPKSHLEQTKQAIFAAGAGQMGNYSCCSWETKGRGQFEPKAKSKPFIGQRNKISYVSECKVETICPANKRKKILRALLQSHPYEHPAYGLIVIGI
jgi:structural toxin protein (hemagglutinin/hemolysin) RtxA